VARNYNIILVDINCVEKEKTSTYVDRPRWVVKIKKDRQIHIRIRAGRVGGIESRFYL